MYFSKIHFVFILEIICVLRCSALSIDFGTNCDVFYNNSCFIYISELDLSWENSRQNCITRGGHLTSINSENEDEMLQNLVKNYPGNSLGTLAWIGLNYSSYNELSNWEDGNPLTYTKVPIINDPDGCIGINGYGAWRSAPCSSSMDIHRICRKPGSAFAIRENEQYQTITNDAITNSSILPTILACRTDTYPQSNRTISWEYKATRSNVWNSMNADTSENGISELAINKNGSYRCHVTSGGAEQIYTTTTTGAQTTIPATTGTTESVSVSMIQTNSTLTPEGISITVIAIGAVVGFVVLTACIIVMIIIIFIIIIICIRKRKPKEYQYLSKIKYSNSLTAAIPPPSVRQCKQKNDRKNYEFLKDVIPGIDITEKELMETLEDSNIEIPESIYSSNYINLPSKSQPKMKLYYEDITEFVDPKMEPIKLDLYKQHLTKLIKNTGLFEEEFKSLGGVTLKYPCENAVMAHNKQKNKYKMIFPYDKSRVILTPLDGDYMTTYINASYIPGLYCTEKFIAAQAPKEETVVDFWRMIMESDVTNIVMLSNIIEGNRKKCEMYFPLDSRTPEQFGKFKIQQIHAETFLGYIVRIFQASNGEKTQKIKHFHFTAWPDQDVPIVYDELLNFTQKVHNDVKDTKSHILVHCSAGVGRTGTFITLFNILSAIEKSQPISIYKVVYEMRESRPQMVQTFRQYKFIYLSVSELLFQDTSIEASEFTSTYKQYLETDIEGYESILYQQFNELNFQTDEIIELPYETGSDPQNAKKNPVAKIVPYDDNRVVLIPLTDMNDYINASYISNLNFIATVHPNTHTMADFLQMVTQTASSLVIMLTTRKEKGEIEGKRSKRASYWGKTDECTHINPFTVRNTHSEKVSTIIKQSLIIENNEDGMSHSVTQLILLAWNDKGEATDIKSILLLIQTMQKYRQENPNLPIIVHCSDGIGRTGVLLTTYKIIEHINNKDAIDIFHVIKGLRSERMHFVPTLNHFLSCFALVNEYCSTTI
ncbi:Receptor-type tyrosine-protein phosphatase epsilon isoform X3 [Oopsacas minuta]|uniref:protein-tyrosine-phosphatase n=1 Tax=Oopsacas minuta TaxID=111878 RepID=A0AAV7JF10_9METZ|nr:Receptor-type tyrosine-protein phosphatase epsilon isoform X3 [Oopsacas minuta]